MLMSSRLDESSFTFYQYKDKLIVNITMVGAQRFCKVFTLKWKEFLDPYRRVSLILVKVHN